MESGSKTCSRCRETKPLGEFVRDNNRKDGFHPQCRGCTALARAARREIDHGACMVPACTRKRRSAQGEYCQMHEKRLRKNGDVGPADSYRDLRDAACSYCGKRGLTIYDPSYPDGGLCEMHYARRRRTGQLGPKARLTQPAPLDGRCSHVTPTGETCDDPYLASGYCAKHYQRIRAGRDPDDPGVARRISNDDAHAQMLAAGAEPQVAYVRSDRKWPCICTRCHRKIQPTLDSVRRGHDPCTYCSGARVDPEAARTFMLSKGLQVTVPFPGSDNPWHGIHVGTTTQPGCNRTTSPSYHSVKTHSQGVCFACAVRGYSESKAGVFYVVSNDVFIKCGIANMRNMNRRLQSHARRSGMELQAVVGFKDGSTPVLMEEIWLRYRSMYPALWATKKEIPDGYTEAMRRTSAIELFISETFFTCGW